MGVLIKDISRDLPYHKTKKNKVREISAVNKIVVHCTDCECSIKDLAKYDVTPSKDNHLSKTGAPSYTYHDTIDKHGTIFLCIPYNLVTWHAGGYNTKSIAVSLMYKVEDKDGNTVSPSYSALKSLKAHLGNLCLKFSLLPTQIFGHRELRGTGWFFFKGHKRLKKTCPGMGLNLDKLRINVAAYMQLILKQKGFYSGKIDGLFGPLSRKAMESYKER